MELHGSATGFKNYVPLFMTFCADIRSYDISKEHYLPSIDVSLGTQNCLLSEHTLSVSLTLLWIYQNKQQGMEFRNIFSIPQHYQIIALAVEGYSNIGVRAPSQKQSELFIMN